MERIKTWIMQLSIRKKLIFYSYLIITPILLLISVLLFCHNYQIALQDEESNCLKNVQGLSDSLEAMQKNIMELGTYIVINSDINRILTADNPRELNRDTLLWTHHAPMQIIQDMVAISEHMKTVAIYPENGVRPYLRCMDSSAYIPNFEEVRKSDIYAQTVSTRGKVLWQRVGKRSSDTYFSNREEKIVMYREIYDMSRKRQLGYLVIGSSADKFDKICSNSLRSEGEMVIVTSSNGAELMRCGSGADELATEVIRQEHAGAKREGLSERAEGLSPDAGNRRYSIYRYISEETGIAVYKLVPRPGLFDMLETVVSAPMALLLGFLISLYPILILVSNIISKPLKELCAAMNEFKQGDFSQKVKVVTRDEVGEASACFNEMVDDMKDLIDRNYVMALKEKESELDTLQAQINPHFLYNTLDSLYWQTIEAGNEKIGEDILALSQLFRLVLGQGNGIVTVRNEQELLERYLYIQKMRFGKRLEYRISISEEVMEESVPKLILQPFVENAIVHGFEKGGDHYSLLVSGEKEKGYIVFHIKDTGIGMSEEQVEAIWGEEDTKKYAGQRIGHYAIKNVRERLELKYHSDFELRIESRLGQGTTVVIRIPCRSEG